MTPVTPLLSKRQKHSQQFLHHINTQDPNIQFTVEEPDQHGPLPSLDTKVTPGPNNTLSTTVYRKPTHTDQYLHWNSNHFVTAKHSVYNTLAHRAMVVSSDQQSLHQELKHIRMDYRTVIFQHGNSTSYTKISNADNITTMNPTQTNITLTLPTAMEPTTTPKTSTRCFLTYRD